MAQPVMVRVARSPQLEEYFDLSDLANQGFMPFESSPQARPRPTYDSCFTVKSDMQQSQSFTGYIQDFLMVNTGEHDSLFAECWEAFQKEKPSYTDVANVCYYLALYTEKDTSWKLALESNDRDKVIAAYESEMASLMNTVLEEILEGDALFEEACDLATPGRILLSIKRSGSYKARGVKQGFKEDRTIADGPDFNYHAHTAKLATVRMAVLRRNRGTRKIALKDMSTAFFQSDKFPPDTKKYVCFKCPLIHRWRYFKQSGPLYGEASAPIRWENTIAPWYQSQEFERGENEPSVFLSDIMEMLSILFVDDNILDGETDDIHAMANRMNNRFECRDLEWLSPTSRVDILGIDTCQDSDYTYMNMHNYILKALVAMGWEDIAPVDTPMNAEIDSESELLNADMIRIFLTACGCLGWLVNTVRLDVAHAHSRCTQHQAKPTVSAMKAIQRVFAYLKGTSLLCIRQRFYTDNSDPNSYTDTNSRSHASHNHGWTFYCDSDYAGNTEPQNKRRSQNGYVVLVDDAPVAWASKVSSVAFANERIGEAHADTSVGAAEIYAASNASIDMVHLSYVAEEMGIDFPETIRLQMDNSAAKCFADNSCTKSKLKHIDCRQQWVKVLRDKEILTAEHVPTDHNLADMFTKILDKATFLRLRSMMMHPLPSELLE